ncbi:Nonribosomal peptide synthetase (fragment) [Frankia canadensis]|uniref:Nonribosomal peptide synthetase n=1 Tax=Frankia canadensis TaxID=1836972 RepID=A0A2I2L290_9ACTN
MTELQDLSSPRSPQRQALLRELARRRATQARIPRRRDSGPVPASYAQTRLWLVGALEQGASAYHVPLPLRFRGPLDTGALADSLSGIVRRHEALRTTLREDDSLGLLQVVESAEAVILPVTDLSGLVGREQGEAVQRQLTDEQTRPFDLASAPLLRARLLRLAQDDHLLLITVHHLGFDGWSVPLLHSELAGGYNARVRGETPQVPEPPLQYADYAVWQRQRLSGARLDELLSYWEERLAGVVPMELPTDRPMSDVTSTRGGTRSVRLSSALMSQLGEIARAESTSLFMTMSAVLGVLFSRHTGQQDLVFGTTSAGRDRSELQGLIGFFNNTLVLRADLSGAPTFRELLRRTRDALVADYAHSELPFDLLVDRLQPPRRGNRTPLFRVHFQVEESTGTLTGYEELPAYHALRAEGLVPEFVTAKFDLSFTVRAAEDGSVVDLVYSTDLFDDSTAERLLEQVRAVVAALVAEPDLSVAALPLPELPRGAAQESRESPRIRQPQQAAVLSAAGAEAITQVLEVWREVLGRDEIGLHVDFFDLGGNSFLATKVRRLLGGRVPMVELFRHRTILSLAAYLSGRSLADDTPERLLHQLTPAGRTPEVTLVCVPYAGGHAVAYEALAGELPARFALWAVGLPGHESGGPDVQLIPLAEATARIADEVQERISGPVVVYGHCAGASQAVDLARELEERGVAVRATYLGGSLTDPDAAANLTRVTDSEDDELYGHIRAIGGFDGPLDPTDLQHLLRALRHDMADATRFQMACHAQPPRRLRAPLHCVLGDADPATPDFATRYRGWQVFADSVSLDVLPGAGHYFIRDRAADLAAVIERRLFPASSADSRTPVVCLAHAGAGASFFHSWRELAGDRLELIPVELPGHEKRFAEDLCQSVGEAVEILLPEVLRAVGDRSEVVLFGHCLGGVIAYELAYRLATTTEVTVRHLVVSGAPGPLVPRERRAAGLPDDEFLARLEELAGYRHPALEDPETAELLLPILRADQEMYESYRRTSVEPLDLPVTALRGERDTLVDGEEIGQWQVTTTRELELAEFTGGHMYHTELAGQVLELMARGLS